MGNVDRYIGTRSELFVVDRILLTYIFQIQVPVVLVPRSPVKMEENAKMGMTEDTIVFAEVDSLERTVRMVSHNLNFLTSSNMDITCHPTVLAIRLPVELIASRHTFTADFSAVYTP